jgi:hypothetical protein
MSRFDQLTLELINRPSISENERLGLAELQLRRAQRMHWLMIGDNSENSKIIKDLFSIRNYSLETLRKTRESERASNVSLSSLPSAAHQNQRQMMRSQHEKQLAVGSNESFVASSMHPTQQQQQSSTAINRAKNGNQKDASYASSKAKEEEDEEAEQKKEKQEADELQKTKEKDKQKLKAEKNRVEEGGVEEEDAFDIDHLSAHDDDNFE